MFYVDLFSALARHKVDYLLIGGWVGANLFAHSTGYMRINSHLQKPGNPFKYKKVMHKLRFLG